MFEGAQLEETHVHYDAAGTVTGKTVVTKDSGWDGYSRSQLLALMEYERRLCPHCRSFDSIVPADPVDRGPADVVWPDGRHVTVRQFRCIACGSLDIVKREWLAEHEKHRYVPWQASPGDGRMFVPQPVD